MGTYEEAEGLQMLWEGGLRVLLVASGSSTNLESLKRKEKKMVNMMI